MKLWTKTLTLGDLAKACERVNEDHPGCTLVVVGPEAGGWGPAKEWDDPTLHEGPRTRWFDRLFLRAIAGNPNQPCYSCKGKGEKDSEPCRSCNGTGCTDATRLHHASWSEHGWWMAEVFKLDPDARLRGYADYRGEREFHRITGYRFTDPRSPREMDVIRALRATARDPRMRRAA